MDSSQTQNNKLAKYRSIRTEGKTPEPFGSTEESSDKLFFVIQKHEATRPHFDFRLEINGVMQSWSIPKGVQEDPAVKRLAMKTEDHPMDYRKFEGTIPEGEYGAGKVTIWDSGTYIVEKEISKGVKVKIKNKEEGETVMEEAVEKGEIKFFLKGKKVIGSFALVKTNGFPPGKTNAWLLIKHK